MTFLDSIIIVGVGVLLLLAILSVGASIENGLRDVASELKKLNKSLKV